MNASASVHFHGAIAECLGKLRQSVFGSRFELGSFQIEVERFTV
jgi:hypothetical protein